MPQLPGVNSGFVPFPWPIDVPDFTDTSIVTISVPKAIAPMVLGAAKALLADSTWNTDSKAVMAQIRELVWQIDYGDMTSFQVDPDDSRYWDYSSDGGFTWTRQPDTVGAMIPATDSEIKTGESHAIQTDPVSAIVNTIAPALGYPGLILQAINSYAIWLESNGLGLHLIKQVETSGTTTSEPVMRIENKITELIIDSILEVVVPE